MNPLSHLRLTRTAVLTMVSAAAICAGAASTAGAVTGQPAHSVARDLASTGSVVSRSSALLETANFTGFGDATTSTLALVGAKSNAGKLAAAAGFFNCTVTNSLVELVGFHQWEATVTITCTR